MAIILETVNTAHVAGRKATGFYSGGKAGGEVYTMLTLHRLNKNNHLSQKRLFSANLRTNPTRNRNLKLLIASHARSDGRYKPR